ncbi:MAG: hypothetical protein QW738_07745 [Nitrososphaeria archaeon]
MIRKGLSPVISTVILSAIMLIITIISIGFAANIYAIQSDSTEFEQAKNMMINFAGTIEYVSSRQGSSAYVKFNSRSGGPQFLSNIGTIGVSVNSSDVLKSRLSVLKYRGGSLSSVAGKYYLRGSDKNIVKNNVSLGSVYVEQSEGAYVVLDFSRINVVYLGKFDFSKGINKGFETVNLIQINFINLTKGEFYGSGSLYAVATCESVSRAYYIISKPSSNPYTLEVAVMINNIEVSSLSIEVEGYDTIVIVAVSNVKISVMG